MANDSRYVQGLKGSTPDSDFVKRFAHSMSDYLDRGGKDIITTEDRSGTETPIWQKMSSRTPLIRPPIAGDVFPEFTYNQFTLSDFYKALRTSNMYQGMIEGLGRASVFADFTCPMPFNKFIQTPLEFGDAVLDTAFTDLSSRPWIKYDKVDSTTGNPPRPLLFNTQTPDMLSSVARCEFSREIPLKINENEIFHYVQTGAMLGEVAGAMAGAVNYCYQRDLYEASKEYFLGCIRIEDEPKPGEGTPTRMSADALDDSPMVEVITVDIGDDMCSAEEFQKVLHRIIENEFYFPSKKYNPYKKETTTQAATLIMSSKYNYPAFQELYAKTYHPDKLGYSMGPSLDLLWVDDIPELVDGIYPEFYEMIGMIVDDRALGIIPVTPYKVGSFYNPQEDSNSLFAHYEFIFKFIPFFNRKYIFLKRNTNDSKKIKGRR